MAHREIFPLIFCHLACIIRAPMPELPSTPVPLGEIVQGPSAFEQFLDRHQKALAVTTVIGAIGIGAWMINRTIQADQALAAGNALFAAKDATTMDKIRKDFAGTPAAVTAALTASDLLWKNGQQDEAIEHLRDILANHSTHPAAAIAQQSLGLRLLAQGKMDDAQSAFEAVIARADASYLAPIAHISLGDIAKSAGKIEIAEKHYRTVINDFSDSSFLNTAQDRLKFLSYQAPTEIEPPPSVEEPPASLAQPTAVEQPAKTGNPLIDDLKKNKD